MKIPYVFFDGAEGGDEPHVSTPVTVGGACLLTIFVDYVFPPEDPDFVSETGDVYRACFDLFAEGRIADGKYFQIPVEPINVYRPGGGGIVDSERGLFEVNVEGLDEVRLVLRIDPPTEYGAAVTVKGNLVG